MVDLLETLRQAIAISTAWGTTTGFLWGTFNLADRPFRGEEEEEPPEAGGDQVVQPPVGPGPGAGPTEPGLEEETPIIGPPGPRDEEEVEEPLAPGGGEEEEVSGLPSFGPTPGGGGLAPFAVRTSGRKRMMGYTSRLFR